MNIYTLKKSEIPDDMIEDLKLTEYIALRLLFMDKFSYAKEEYLLTEDLEAF